MWAAAAPPGSSVGASSGPEAARRGAVSRASRHYTTQVAAPHSSTGDVAVTMPRKHLHLQQLGRFGPVSRSVVRTGPASSTAHGALCVRRAQSGQQGCGGACPSAPAPSTAHACISQWLTVQRTLPEWHVQCATAFLAVAAIKQLARHSTQGCRLKAAPAGGASAQLGPRHGAHCVSLCDTDRPAPSARRPRSGHARTASLTRFASLPGFPMGAGQAFGPVQKGNHDRACRSAVYVLRRVPQAARPWRPRYKEALLP